MAKPHWHLAANETPPKSGQYLCAVDLGLRNEKHIFVNEFNEKWGFSYDHNAKNRGEKTRVYAWCEIPPLPDFKQPTKSPK